MPLAGGRLTSRQAMFGHGSSRQYLCGSPTEARTCRMWCVNVVRHESQGPTKLKSIYIRTWIAALAHLQDDTNRRPTNTSIRDM